MTKKSLINNKQLWDAFCFIDQMDQAMELEKISEILRTPQKVIIEAIQFYQRYNAEVFLEKNGRTEVLYPPKDKVRINLNLSLSEWFALQSHFSILNRNNNQVTFSQLRNVICETEEKNSKFDLFDSLEKEEVSLDEVDLGNNLKDDCELIKESVNDEYEFSLNEFEQAIVNRSSLILNFFNNTAIKFFPIKLVVIDEELSVVGEEVNDHCLSYLPLKSIADFSIDTLNYNSRVDLNQVHSFVSGLRELSETKVRMVLKIFDDSIDLTPPFQLIDRPYVAMTWEGNRIWGASVELNNELFEWLDTYGEKIEILDPFDLKEQFRSFLSQKLKNAA